jgi:hypothetical protein
MKHKTSGLWLVAVGMVVTIVQAATMPKEVADKLKRGVVRLEVQKSAGGSKSIGAGIVAGLDKESLFIATAFHTIADAKKISVRFANRTDSIEGTLVNTVDRDLDIGVVSINRNKLPDDLVKGLPVFNAIPNAERVGGLAPGTPGLTVIGQNSPWEILSGGLEKVKLDNTLLGQQRFSVVPDANSSSLKGVSGGPVFGPGPQWRLMGLAVGELPKSVVAVKIDAVMRLLQGDQIPVNRLDPLADQPDKPYLWVLTSKHVYTLDLRGQLRTLNYEPALGHDGRLAAPRVISADPTGAYAVIVNNKPASADGIVRINLAGDVAWRRPGNYRSVSISDGGRIFALRGPSGGNSSLEELDPESGKPIGKSSELGFEAADIVVDDRNNWVWAAGNQIAQFNLELGLIWNGHPGWYTSIDFGPSGDVVVLKRGNDDGQVFTLEPKIHTIRAFGEAIVGARQIRVARSGRAKWDIYVVGDSPEIVQYNGQAVARRDRWRAINAPRFVGSAVSGDGVVWLATSKSLLRCERGGEGCSELAPGSLAEDLYGLAVTDNQP